VLTSVGENMDRVLLHAFAGVAAVGQYSAGMRLGGMLQYLSQAVAGLVLPSLSRAYAEGRKAAAFELCARAERRLALVLLPLMLGITGVANPLALRLLGDRYSDTGPVIVFGTMAMVFQVLAQPHRQIVAGAERLILMVVGQALQFAVQMGMLYGALSVSTSLEGVGAVQATAAAMAASAFVGIIFWHGAAARFLGAPIERRTWIHIVSALLLFIPVCTSTYLFDRWSFVPGAVAALSLLCHVVVLRATGELGASEVAFVSRLLTPRNFAPSVLSSVRLQETK
jgi:O-antigen/teichoic acid export membrane protein